MFGAALTDNLPLIAFALSLLSFLFLTRRRPERLSNSLFLFLALILLLPTAVSLLGENGATVMLLLAFSLIAAVLLVPLMLIWNGIVMIRRESGRLANILSLLLGIAIAAGETALLFSLLRGEALFSGASAPFLRLLVWLFGLSVFYFSVLLLAFVLYALLLPLFSRVKAFDTVIVHGCALIRGDKVSRILANRLDLALKLFHASGGAALLVVSGGQGDDETVSEAEAMAAYLRGRGVPEKHILREDQSHTTRENLVNAMRLLASRGGAGRLALVTSGYHLYRCVLLARRLGLRCCGFGARVAAYYWPSAVIREFAAVFSRKPHLVWALLGYGLFVLVPVLLIALSSGL